MIPEVPNRWPGLDGQTLGCREKLKMLAENYREASQILSDVFEDAVLMGVDEQAMRQVLIDIVMNLESPKRSS